MTAGLPMMREPAERRRGLTRAVSSLAGAGLLLGGCVYDPYTGTYVPCCAAPAYSTASPQTGPAQAEVAGPPSYPGPAYPPPGYPPPAYGRPPAPPYAGAPPGYPAAPPDPPGEGARPRLAQRFAQANVTQDGRLTQAQAQQAHWHVIVRNFPAIDVQGKGYVTLGDIEAWMAARHRAAPAQPG